MAKFIVRAIRNTTIANAEFGFCDYLLVTDSGNKLYPMMVYRIVKKYLDPNYNHC